MSRQDDEAVVELAMRAGHILLENGAEIYRVDETMGRICSSFGVESENAFVLSNGIFVTAGDRKENVFAKVEHIPVSGTNLEKVTAVNQLSREIAKGHYTIEEADRELTRIQNMPDKSKIVLILSSGMGSAGFCFLFGGTLMDSFAAFVAGVLLYLYILYVSGPYLSKIVGNLVGGLIVTVVCSMFYFLGLGNFNSMIIGAIMPLIPGVAFVNSIRDIADGDYISGAVRMLDAVMVFFCIASGVGMGITVINNLTGGALL